MSISPGNINKLNKIAGISSVINVNATNYATYANTVFKANLLIKLPSGKIVLTDGVETLAELEASPLVDKVLSSSEKTALNAAFSTGSYVRAANGVVAHGDSGKISDDSLNFVADGKIVPSYLSDYIEDGKFTIDALPDTARAGMVYVSTYADLANLTDEQKKSLVYVADATDDPSGNTKAGGALYAYASNAWTKIAEPESLDIDADAIKTNYDHVQTAGAVMYDHDVLLATGAETDANILEILAVPAKNYSFIIDFSLSDPASMITYADDSDAAAMSTDWFDILGLKLCVLKDGKVLYYLNPDNVTKQINGSPADITTLGNDVMLEIPRMGTNCMWLDSNRLKITITTAPSRAGYDYRAFSLHKYNDCDKIYIGRYYAHIDHNKLYSCSNEYINGNYNLAQYRTYATNRGTGYTDIGICDNILLQCLYFLIVKNMNSQSAVGVGIAKTNVRISTTGSANTFGWLNHNAPNKTNGTTAICCLGIEDLWGNVFAVEDGIIKAASTNTISMAQYADQYNSDGTGYEVVANIGTCKNGRYGYPKRFLGLPKFIFAPDLSLEPTSGYDIAYVDTNGTTVSRVGGYHSSGNSWDENGILRRDFWNSATSISDYMCTRLVYKHVQEGLL